MNKYLIISIIIHILPLLIVGWQPVTTNQNNNVAKTGSINVDIIPLSENNEINTKSPGNSKTNKECKY